MVLTAALGMFGLWEVFRVATHLDRAAAGIFLVFAVFVVSFPPSNKTGALLVRLERVWVDIGGQISA